MKKCYYFLLLLVFSSASLIVSAQDLTKLDEYIESARKQFGIPGMAVGIVKDGKVVFQKGYGLRDSDKKDKVDENTLFAIASVTKAFTVTGLGMLVDEGKIDWSDKVTSHLPYFRLHDDYATSLMNIEDLTCHRSGLSTFDGDLLWYGTYYSRREIVERIRELPLTQTFRVDFGYQNIMYITSGQVIEEVSGISWDDYLRDRIFKPLGMNSTVTTVNGFTKETNVAYPHLKGKRIDVLSYDNSGATAAMNSNVSDMCKWINFWLNDCIVGKDTFLTAATRQRIFTPHTVLSAGRYDETNGTHFKSYGMGWFLMDYKGLKVAHHGGGLPGYITKIALVPEQNLGMIIVTNDMSNLPSALMYRIIDLYAGNAEKDWAGEFHGFYTNYDNRLNKQQEARIASRKTGTLPSHSLDDYSGKYTDKMYGDATVTLLDGELQLVLEPTKQLFTGKLEHWHYDTFKVEFQDPFLPFGLITFYAGENGKLQGFKIDLPNDDFNFYNLDFKRSGR